MVTVEKIMAEAQKNNRVCPQPQHWQKLYEMLPNKKRKGAGWEPALPLILAAWWDTPAISKILRFREHIQWAESQGCFDQIDSFLHNLTEEQWYHTND